jgi:deoxycytidylate deaminase
MTATTRKQTMTSKLDTLLLAPTPQANGVYTSRVTLHQRISAAARLWAELSSKDPNTKVAAAIYHLPSGALYLGYNGMPRGLADTVKRWDNRDREDPRCKYNAVIHAEENVLDKLPRGLRPDDCIFYVSNHPCHRCARLIIHTGFRTVWFSSDYPPDPIADSMFAEAGVDLKRLHDEVLLC